MHPLFTLFLSLVVAGLVKLVGGPNWLCVIVTAWTFMLLWMDSRLALLVGLVEDLREDQRRRSN
jgi:hypothetical protein